MSEINRHDATNTSPGAQPARAGREDIGAESDTAWRADAGPPGRPAVRGVAAALAFAAVGFAGLAAGVYWHQPLSRLMDLDTNPGAEATLAAGPKQLWTCGMHPQVIQDQPGTCPICHMELTPLEVEEGSASTAADGGERKIKYWWDPMLGPSSISDGPGKSAMGMDLVPVYEDEVSGGPAVTIDPVIVQNMGVRVAPVTRGVVQRTIRAFGSLAEAQPNIHDVNLRVSGWVEKLYANTVGIRLKAGDPLFELYSPEIQIAVNELIVGRRGASVASPLGGDLARTLNQTLTEATRLKLEQWGLDAEQIEQLAAAERAPRTVTFVAPRDGHLTEKPVVEGAAVTAGDRVLRIVDLSTLWLDAQVYEQDLAFVRVGQVLSATVASMASRTYEGKVIFIQPRLDPLTRSATVRIALPNADLELRPGMFATAQIQAQLAQDALLVPREAVIDTGERQVVFVAAGGGRFEPRKIKAGLTTSDGEVEVLEGLRAGETVVVSGQFLLDAESRMKEAIQKHLSERLLASPAETAPVAPPITVPEHTGHRPSGAEAAPPADPGDGDALSDQLDAVYTAYLGVAQTLGEPQTLETPIDVSVLVSSLRALLTTEPASRPVCQAALDAAVALERQPIPEQRKRFKALSIAMLAMADATPPSSRVVEQLFVAYCPMEQASWLQSTSAIANPYYGTHMKACREVQRRIAPRKAIP